MNDTPKKNIGTVAILLRCQMRHLEFENLEAETIDHLIELMNGTGYNLLVSSSHI